MPLLKLRPATRLKNPPSASCIFSSQSSSHFTSSSRSGTPLPLSGMFVSSPKARRVQLVGPEQVEQSGFQVRDVLVEIARIEPSAEHVARSALRLAALCVLCGSILVVSQMAARMMPDAAVLLGDRRPAPLVIEDPHRVAQHWHVDVLADPERERADAVGGIEDVIGARRPQVTEIGIPDAVPGQLADLALIPGLGRAAISHGAVGLATDLEPGPGPVALAGILPLDRIGENRHLSRPRQPAKLVDRDLRRDRIGGASRTET